MESKEKILDRAQKNVQKGYIDRAIADYRAAYDMDPRDIAMRLRIGDLYVKSGRNTEAIKEYTDAAKANSERGFYLKAIAVYKQVLKLDEANLDIHVRLAELYTKQRLIADAISEYGYIVNAFERKGKTVEVLELIKKMIAIDPENVGIRHKLAELYQKMRFDKDALAEYAAIYSTLMAQGKTDRAEKIYMALSSAYPSNPQVLKGLLEISKKKGDSAQAIHNAKALFRLYSSDNDADKAKEMCAAVLDMLPLDAECSKYMKRFEPPPVADVRTETISAAVDDEPLIAVPDFDAIEEPVPSAPDDELVKAEEPVLFLPDEGIEMDIDGFEDIQLPDGHKESAITGASVIAPVDAPSFQPLDLPGLSDEPLIELDIAGLMGEGAGPVSDAAAAEAPLEEPLIDIEIPGEFPAPSAAEVAAEAVIEAVCEEPPPVLIAAVPPSTEGPLEEPLEEPLIDIEIPGEFPAPSAADVAAEAVIEAVGEENPPFLIATVPPSTEGPLDEPLIDVEIPVELPAPSAAEEGYIPVVEEEAKDDIEGAFSELMEKISPAEVAAVEKEEAVSDAVEGAPVAVEEEDYVDLTAELGMEESVKDMVGAWGTSASKETIDELSNGFGESLSREDAETHYNLGIAYMEMELHKDAAKEFKVAMKDANLEFDCYTRLGLCALAEGNPQDAIIFYKRGLKIEGAGEDARKGMLYELALAHEAADEPVEALEIFRDIHSTDAGYREVGKKLRELLLGMREAPLDDGMIEVELL